MSLTLDKLRALKRQAGATDVTTPAASAVPSSLQDPVARAPWDTVLRGDDALRRTADTAASIATQAAAGTPSPPALDSSIPPSAASTDADDTSIASARTVDVASLRRLLGLRERPLAPRARRREIDRVLPGIEIDAGLWLVESQVAHPIPDAPLPLAFARRDDHVQPEDLLFFDTETTGLAGGTGTRAFMIGAADWHDGALRIRQLLIANMAAEAAMLRTFASWLSPSTVLASYNGRSYDAPLLRTRYRLARLKDPMHGLDHLDLLHPARRRWRGRWENCRLATIEREALRILREDDLPGAQAPAAWLGYLRGGDAVNLRRVTEHNRQDVATLAQLLLRLCDARDS